MKIFKQMRAPPSHVKERAYPKQVSQDGGVKRYGGMKFRKNEAIFTAYDKAETKVAKILFFLRIPTSRTPPNPCFGPT